MKDGFVKVAAITPEIRVADCSFNANRAIEKIRVAQSVGARLVVLPELCLTGYTAGDLFWSGTLLSGALDGLETVLKETENYDALIFVGLPLAVKGRVYNCAAALHRGEILGIVPKSNLPEYHEFYEKRQFTPAPDCGDVIKILGRSVPFGTDIIFRAADMPNFSVAVEICEDLWGAVQPSQRHALAGANVIVNLSASNETVGKAEYRRALVTGQSGRLIAAYAYADAGEGESTTDVVFAAHNLIAENGRLLAESEPFGNGIAISEVDVDFLARERSVIGGEIVCDHLEIEFDTEITDTVLTREFAARPFVPEGDELNRRASLILDIQANALKKRIAHTKTGAAVVGVSGGLDSCLALLVTVRAFRLLSRPLDGIIAVSMPCFGTTKRTRSNAEILARELGVTFRTVDITAAVRRHFKDIGHDESLTDVTYENSQARERTQVLMDIANENNGMVIGTGDLSELALGWATYNGDHMSMYGVNCSVPKTLVRYLVAYEADHAPTKKLQKVLRDILATPVSPELLPAKEGEIAQKTEEIVGPYDLHDFFIYNFVRLGYGVKKIYRVAKIAFSGVYDDETIKKWLGVFVRRFFAQQFKRSCVPDGVKVGSVALSPRGDLRMPSDACAKLWLDELDEIK